jgi:hypothetical protein
MDGLAASAAAKADRDLEFDLATKGSTKSGTSSSLRGHSAPRTLIEMSAGLQARPVEGNRFKSEGELHVKPDETAFCQMGELLQLGCILVCLFALISIALVTVK